MNKKSKKPTISVLIAALNEENIIKKTVDECFSIVDYSMDVYVVLDDKTTDKTAQVAKKAGAKIIKTGKWLGKGAALRKALPYATADYTVLIDADYQFLPRDIPKLINPLQDGYDVTLGTRYEKGAKVEAKSVTPLRRFGIYFLSLATSIACRQRVTDVLAGFKAFKTPVLNDLHMEIDHYGYEAEVVIKAAQKGYKILNVPIQYKQRKAGKSNVNPIKHGTMFLGSILKVWLKL